MHVDDPSNIDPSYEGAMNFYSNSNNPDDDPYSYDANENLSKDMHKNIESITYTMDNKPSKLTFEKIGSTYKYNI